MPTDTLDEMVRDFTQAVPRSKSEVRSRIVAAMETVRREEHTRIVEWCDAEQWDTDAASNDPTNDFIAHDAYASKADAFYNGYNQALIDLRTHLDSLTK
jgi:hypothetical protein